MFLTSVELPAGIYDGAGGTDLLGDLLSPLIDGEEDSRIHTFACGFLTEECR